jgi:hypothetical protein
MIPGNPCDRIRSCCDTVPYYSTRRKAQSVKILNCFARAFSTVELAFRVLTLNRGNLFPRLDKPVNL